MKTKKVKTKTNKLSGKKKELKEYENKVIKIQGEIEKKKFELFKALHEYIEKRREFGFPCSCDDLHDIFAESLDKSRMWFQRTIYLSNHYDCLEEYEDIIEKSFEKEPQKRKGLTLSKAKKIARRSNNKKEIKEKFKKCHDEKWSMKEVVSESYQIKSLNSRLSSSLNVLNKYLEKLNISDLNITRRGSLSKRLFELEKKCKKIRKKIQEKNKKEYGELFVANEN